MPLYGFVGSRLDTSLFNPATGANALTINTPPGSQAGDLIVIGVAYIATSFGQTISLPAGFTAISAITTSGTLARPGCLACTRILAAAAPASYAVTYTSGAADGDSNLITWCVIYRRFTGFTTNNSVGDSGAYGASPKTATEPSQANTAGSAPQLLLYLDIVATGTGFTQTPTWAPDSPIVTRDHLLWDNGVNSKGSALWVGDEQWASAAAFPARSMVTSWEPAVTARHTFVQLYPTVNEGLVLRGVRSAWPVAQSAGLLGRSAWPWAGP